MDKSKNDKPKIKVETINASSSEEYPKVADSSFNLLRKEAVTLGMPQEDVDKFDNEETLKVTVNALKASKADKVVTLEEKVNPKEEREVEKKWRDKAQRQKEYFNSLPKVRVLIPCDSTEKPGVVEERKVNGIMQTVVVSGAVWSKTFNGYRVVVPKGVYYEVSEAVADNIAEEFNQVIRSNAQFGLDRTDTTTGRPVREQL
jgi:hypothetical protein